jgi:hypothetical protein
MNKTLSAMVAAATLCLASQASAGTVNFIAGTGVTTGIAGLFGDITYSTKANYGTATYALGVFSSNSQIGIAKGTTNGVGVNATPGGADTSDAGYRNVIDSRVNGASVHGAWEMLTITFSESVNLANFILGRMDENDDFEYSFNGGSFLSVGPDIADPLPPGFVLTFSDRTYAGLNNVTTFRIRATGTSTTDDDDFTLKAMNVSAVPLPAGAPLLLAGLAGLAFLRRRKQA